MTEVLGALDPAQVAAIRAARETMIRSALAADWDMFVQVFDEKAVVMPPNVEPLDTRAKLRAFVGTYPKISAFRVTAIEIDGRADLACERGRYALTVGGVSEQGSSLTLWRKQADGSWKIFRDIWHSDRAASG